jgi:dTDP-L-oleandrosyltransferase
MGHIVFLSIPAHGHVTPTLGVVEELVGRGHRVTFPTTEEFSGTVGAVGAEVLRYESTWPVPASLPNPADADSAAEMRLLLATESIAVADALAPISAAGPGADVVVYDTATSAAARVLATSWERPAVELFTGVASNERFSLAKYWPDRFPAPDGDPDHPMVVERRSRLAEFGRRCLLDGTRSEDLAAHPEELSVVFQPRSFHIAAETFDERYVFVGPCLSSRAFSAEWQPPADSRPVLLISLGTLYNNQPDFFRACEDAFSCLEWNVVMLIGHQVDPGDLGPAPANFERHRRVPQPAVLRHAAAFLTHGGMGGTMEALFFGTPLVVVPQTPEQDAVARRVAELGLGLRIPPGEVSVDKLRKMVVDVASNEATGERVRRMRRLVVAAGGSPRAADAIVSRLRPTGAT